MSAQRLEVRPLGAAERSHLRELLAREWGSPRTVSRGQIHDAAAAEALGAFVGQRLVGFATYEITCGQAELLTLNALEPRRGIGSAVLDAAIAVARAAGCQRLWLITTNENDAAIRFYERRGLNLVAVHHGAADEARRLKPEIPEFAPDGTRISDELEYELVLT